MTYPLEDEGLDLQRMPGTRRPATHTPARTDTTVHTVDHPFCYDPACSCHRDRQAIEQVNSWVQQGSMKPDEATNFILGRTF